ncbi:hypothetical protein FDUTEX481_08276 [Tolypothrix sp. PCC 7601]|nr:hypothetical protein FDUTEX481_08276 [Tolypothrix sp. PCC 7601]BAY90479.1 hypothetical protein NIES3275_24950 [Microchaete diplosiphon NIES-3275]
MLQVFIKDTKSIAIKLLIEDSKRNQHKQQVIIVLRIFYPII